MTPATIAAERDDFRAWVLGLRPGDEVAVICSGSAPYLARVTAVTKSCVVVGLQRFSRSGKSIGLRAPGHTDVNRIEQPTTEVREAAEYAELANWVLERVKRVARGERGAPTLEQLRAVRTALEQRST